MSALPASYLLEIITQEQYNEICKNYRGFSIYIPKSEYEHNEVRDTYQAMIKQGIKHSEVIKRVAEYHEISTRTVYRMKQNGELDWISSN